VRARLIKKEANARLGAVLTAFGFVVLIFVLV